MILKRASTCFIRKPRSNKKSPLNAGFFYRASCAQDSLPGLPSERGGQLVRTQPLRKILEHFDAARLGLVTPLPQALQ
jgi:hypothetical protein